jgi:hypothetical protein
MEFLRLIEQSAPMVWLREGGSIWGYPAVLFMHTLGLGTVAGISGAIDLRVLGFSRGIPLSALLPLFRVMWWALVLTLISGLILLFADAIGKLSSPVFYIKMLFVAVGVFGVLRQQREMADETAPIGTGSSSARTWAVASLVCWVAAITAGRLIAYLGPIQGLG